jgi:hypothetical protein
VTAHSRNAKRCMCNSDRPIVLKWTGRSEWDALFWCTACAQPAPGPRLPKRLRDALRSWAEQYSFVYRLWLASSCYETWAANELDSLSSPINELGRDILRNVRHETNEKLLYWLERTEKKDPPATCLGCQDAWQVTSEQYVACPQCCVLMPVVQRGTLY